MKIQKVTPDNQIKAYALLKRAFPVGSAEPAQVEAIHQNGTLIHDWIAVHAGKAIGYIAFTTAYRDNEPCGLHLRPVAVAPNFQRQGVASELIHFALRQTVIKDRPLFVLGAAGFFQRFGFRLCKTPQSALKRSNTPFLSQGDHPQEDFAVGYEAELLSAKKTGR